MHTGMKSQHASLLTVVPSAQVAVPAAGAARATEAARATTASREVKAIVIDKGVQKNMKVERARLTGCRCREENSLS